MKRKEWLLKRVKKNQYAWLSFLLPIFILAMTYLMVGIYPGSEKSILASDAFGQYSNFFASFNNMMKSQNSIFYTWTGSLGLNYLSFISYYLGGLFTPLVYFFDNQNMPDFLYYLTLLKVGCIGLAFWVFASRTFLIPKWGNLGLSCSYALMSFTIATSEIVMWMDGFLYLPLVILGIHRLISQQKIGLLFCSYFLVFTANFYIGFIVGVYSFLYFIIRLGLQKRNIFLPLLHYTCTSLLAGGASMFLLLPTVRDLQMNGEALTPIKTLKTAATGPWDLIIKNMVGVYDTTRFGSIPFIYVGLLPLLFALFFFLTKKVGGREKIGYGSLLLLLVFSFYLEPLNLFWHGLHAPNMFLFRFSFLFSFTLLLLAGYGGEVYRKEDFEKMVNSIIGLLLLFTIVRLVTSKNSKYDYLTYTSFILTLLFLVSYLLLLFLHQRRVKMKISLFFLLFMVSSIELGMNTSLLIRGVEYDWGYAQRGHYEDDYESVSSLVAKTKALNPYFYRIENLTATSPNESFRYNYSSVGMFSSIRNRHSSYYLNTLGFQSGGTNLNIRYQNNVVMMDAIMGVKYNLSNQKFSKVGFEEVEKAEDYRLYQNQNVLPMGILTEEKIFDPEASSDPESLLSTLAGTEKSSFFREEKKPEMVEMENVVVKKGEKYNQKTLVLKAKNKDKKMKIKWKVPIEKDSQAYLKLVNAAHRYQARVTVETDRQKTIAQTAKDGQYYNMGFYTDPQEVIIETIFDQTDKVEIFDPTVVSLNTTRFTEAVKKAREQGVEFTVSGRQATATVETEKERVLFTTIAPDKGWKAKIDNQEVPLHTIQDGVLSIVIPPGKHKVEFTYLPQGFLTGAILSIFSIILFAFYLYILKRRKLWEDLYSD